MRVKRSKKDVRIFVEEPMWAPVALSLAGEYDVTVGPIEEGMRLLILPPELSNDQLLDLLAKEGFDFSAKG